MPASHLPGPLSGRDNALNAIRLVLASGVILSHAFDLVAPSASPLPGGLSLGGWCVSGFFAVSGYLVAASRASLGLPRFLARRAARIFPGFWACLLVTAAVAAPLATALSPREQVDPASAVGYVARNLGLWIVQGDIEHTLRTSPVPGDWNGSLWTLSFEFAAYVGLALLLGLARRGRARFGATAAALALCTVGNLIVEVRGSANSVPTHAVWLAGFFLAGAALRLCPRPVPVRASFAAAAVVLLVAAAMLDLPQTLAPVPFCYLLLVAGAVLPVRVGARNDVSYGVYVYAFPITQLLLVARPRWDPWLLSLAVLVLVVPVAWTSWRLVERPAMRLERRLEARTVRTTPAVSAT